MVYTPHSCVVKRHSNPEGVVAGKTSAVEEYSLACQITPLTAGTAYFKFGVESRAPWLIMYDAENSALKPGDELEWDGNVYRVISTAERYTIEDLAAHSSNVIEVLQYA